MVSTTWPTKLQCDKEDYTRVIKTTGVSFWRNVNIPNSLQARTINICPLEQSNGTSNIQKQYLSIVGIDHSLISEAKLCISFQEDGGLTECMVRRKGTSQREVTLFSNIIHLVTHLIRWCKIGALDFLVIYSALLSSEVISSCDDCFEELLVRELLAFSTPHSLLSMLVHWRGRTKIFSPSSVVEFYRSIPAQ